MGENRKTDISSGAKSGIESGIKSGIKPDKDACGVGTLLSQGLSTRRLAIQTALGVGYALAAYPLIAQTAIRTSSLGLDTTEVMLERDGFKFPVFVAKPSNTLHPPVVLVISEIFGVHEYIADVARRFAQAGYCAIAPELFARQGDPSEYAQLSKLQSEVIDKVPDHQVLSDLDACVLWAKNQGFDVDRLAINGFCWGGRIAWLYAAQQEKLKAAAVWYGRLQGTQTPNTPKHPLDLMQGLRAPVLGLYGDKDPSIALESIQRMQEKLQILGRAGVKSAQSSRFVIYPGVGHAFHADYRSSYDQGAAADAWQQTLAWFKEWLRA